MGKLTLLVVLAILLPACPTPAQAWGQRFFDVQPITRHDHAMAFDEARGEVVLFGGFWALNGILGDTWLYDGVRWRLASSSRSPSPRARHAMAYDSHRARVMLIGGIDSTSTHLADMWEWDGSEWTRIAPPTAIPAVADHGLAYDSIRKRMVLVVGPHNPGRSLWEYDGMDWIQVPVPQLPTTLYGHAVAFDAARGRVVVAGGEGENRIQTSAVGEWDGFQWHPAPPLPYARSNMGLIYQVHRSRLLLCGGEPLYNKVNSTYEYDGWAWRYIPSTLFPEWCSKEAIAFDSARRVTVIFGFRDMAQPDVGQTWEFVEVGPATFTTSGPGCPGSHLEISRLEPRGLPALGLPFGFGLHDAPPLACGALFLSWTPAAFELGVYGAPGCTARANGHVAFPLCTDFDGTWSRPILLRVPGEASLRGLEFFVQGFLLDSRANALGLIVSNGIKGVVGL